MLQWATGNYLSYVKKEQLQHLTEKRTGFSESEILQLQQLTGEYPYFSGAHILLSMAFHENNDHRRVHQLGATAARVSSRVSLKSLTSNVQYLKENSAHIDISATTTIADIILTEESPDQPVEIAMPVIDFNSEAAGEPENSTIEEVATVDIANNELQGLQAGILIEAIQSSIELEVSHNEEGSSTDTDTDITLSTYTAWLLQRAHSLESMDVTHDTSNFVDDVADANISFVTTSEMIPLQSKRPATNTNWSVIDRFIETEPQIAKGKVGAYSSGDLTRGSFKEEDEFFTETMARLLAQQGKTDKARWVFKKLMEIHPEKSIYFATQLKNLELIKNK